jgi:hypothetical protein
LVQFITPSYAARIAQVMASVAASLARAPDSPQNFMATGDAIQGIKLNFNGPLNGDVDHFVVAARSVNENFYRQRIIVSEGDGQLISPQALGLNPGDSFFVSVSTVDSAGHESLFAWPEVRCDSSACVIPPYAATFDPTSSATDNQNVDED